MKQIFYSFLFITCMLMTCIGCDNEKTKGDTDNPDEKGGNVQVIHLLDSIYTVLVPNDPDAEEMKEIDQLFRTSLGEVQWGMGLFENATARKRVKELIGEPNFRFITDTCNIKDPLEFRDEFFTYHGKIHHQEDEDQMWLLFSPSEDNMMVFIWKDPITWVYWNKEYEFLTSPYIISILEEIALMRDFKDDDDGDENEDE